MGNWIYFVIALFTYFKGYFTIKSINKEEFFIHPFIVKPNTVCGNTPGLTPTQSRLCSQQPYSVASAIQGVQVAIHECKEQFKGNRWNCSSLDERHKLPQSCSFIKYSNENRESAFSHAITSAGVVHQVAHACSLGKIQECECPQARPSHMTASERKKFRKTIEEKQERTEKVSSIVHLFEKAGCNHNINYGMEFAVLFLDSHNQQDFVSEIRSHNNRVGRLIVSNNMIKNCRCHGTSGSCSQQTCWRKTPDFKAVGKAIKEKYLRAVKVSDQVVGNRVKSSNEISERAELVRDSFSYQDLIYLDDSPSYCSANRRINVSGTQGRFCNRTAGNEVSDSCQSLCCSRGYTTHAIKRTEQCRCRFHWCCYVDCEQCVWEETVSICN